MRDLTKRPFHTLTSREKEEYYQQLEVKQRQFLKASVLPPHGPIWETIRSENSDVPEQDLILLLRIAIEFWWTDSAFRCNEYRYDEAAHERRCVTNAELGHREHWGTRYGATTQKVILVRGAYYSIVRLDRVRGEPAGLEVGTHPGRGYVPWGVDQREMVGYRRILYLPDPLTLSNWEQSQPAHLFSKEVERYWAERADDAMARGRAEDEDTKRFYRERNAFRLNERVRVLLNQAWTLQYVLMVWCGVTIHEHVWLRTVEEALAIPNRPRDPQGKVVGEGFNSFKDLSEELRFKDREDAFLPGLQAQWLLRLAQQIRSGVAVPGLVDPCNIRTSEFQQALHHFRGLPGFSTNWVDEVQNPGKAELAKRARDNTVLDSWDRED